MEETREDSNFWKELAKLILLSILIIIPFRLYIAQPFIVDGASMDPTFENGQYLIIDELSYRFREPVRGEVLIFKYPKDPSKYFIKRIIGLPGETVLIKNGVVTLINDKYPKGLTLEEPYVKFTKVDNSSLKLGENEYFVMGDNRLQSADSRYWGPVPRENFIGLPIFRLFPLGLSPGSVLYEDNEPAN